MVVRRRERCKILTEEDNNLEKKKCNRRVMGRARSSRLTRNKIESMFVQGIRQGAMHLRWLSKEIYYQT